MNQDKRDEHNASDPETLMGYAGMPSSRPMTLRQQLEQQQAMFTYGKNYSTLDWKQKQDVYCAVSDTLKVCQEIAREACYQELESLPGAYHKCNIKSVINERLLRYRGQLTQKPPQEEKHE